MGKKGGGGSQATTQQAEPWAGVQPNLMDLYRGASNYFTGPGTTPGMNNDQGQAIAMMRDTALSGGSAQLRTGAQATMNSLTSGSYLNGNPVSSGQMLHDNPFAQDSRIDSNKFATGSMGADNPYLNAMVNAATRDVTQQFKDSIAPSLASQFSAAGRLGSGSNVAAFGNAAGQLAERLGDTTANIRGQAYETDMNRMSQAYESERQRQANAYEAERGGQRAMFMNAPQVAMQGASLAPAIANMQYADADRLFQAGSTERDIQQEVNDDPLKKLQNYSSILQGANGWGTQSGTQSSKMPYNRLAGAIGGGLGGMALLGPWGAALGALGGLMG